MPSDAQSMRRAYAVGICSRIARENATDGRTDGLTKKHSPQVDISPNASRAICIEFASSGPSGCTREATG